MNNLDANSNIIPSTNSSKTLNTNSFVHLDVHSAFSLGQSIVTIDKLLTKVKSQNMTAVGIADCMNCFAAMKFYQKAKAIGIKPVIGIELRCLTNIAEHNLVLENLAEVIAKNSFKVYAYVKNLNGFKQLSGLLTSAYLNADSQEQAFVNIFGKDSLSQCQDILVVLTFDSNLSKYAASQNYDAFIDVLKKYQEVFSDRLFLGISSYGAEYENYFNVFAARASQQLSLPILANNKVCFLEQEEYDIYYVRYAIQNQIIINSEQEQERECYPDQYFKTEQEMLEQKVFARLPFVLEQNKYFAQMCNLEFEFKTFLPELKNIDVNKDIISRTNNALQNYIAKNKQNIKFSLIEYQKRLDYELEVIIKMNFASYFLIVAEFVNWAQKNDIPVGLGRGSGAGSLVAFLFRITGLDPLEYNLIFERFLNPERVSMPDFDIDFCPKKRDAVIAHVREIYGSNSVSQIATFGTLSTRAVIKDVARVLNFSYYFGEEIVDMIPKKLGITIADSLKESHDLKDKYLTDTDIKKVIDISMQLEGLPRNIGTHAGGVVIAPSNISNFCPVYLADKNSIVVTQFDKDDIETIGLVKFDFLGLSTLTVIDDCVKQINANQDKQINISNINLQDDAVYQLISSGNTAGVFQLESTGIKVFIKKLKPDNLEDLIALLALYRPGPMESEMDISYINRKHGKEEISYPDRKNQHPSLKPILETTYGVMVYQEQVMQISQVLAGFSMGEADNLRKAMGKKQPEVMAKLKEDFVSGGVLNKIDKNLATSIYEYIEKFAGYGFNRSHSAAYAIIAYQTAWLKLYYKEYFYVAHLNDNLNNHDQILELLVDAKSNGMQIIQPDILQCSAHFVAQGGNAISYGLAAIKGVGERITLLIDRVKKEHGTFKSIQDFCIKVRQYGDVGLKRLAIENMIKAGVFDSLHQKCRKFLLQNLDIFISLAEQKYKENSSGQIGIFGNSDTDSFATVKYKKPNKEFSKIENLLFEKDLLGIWISGSPMDNMPEIFNTINFSSNKKINSAALGHMTTLDEFKNNREAEDFHNLRYKISSIEFIVAASIVRISIQSNKKGFSVFILLDDNTELLEVVYRPRNEQELEKFKANYKVGQILYAVIRLNVFNSNVGANIKQFLSKFDMYSRCYKGVMIALSSATDMQSIHKINEFLRQYKVQDAKHKMIKLVIYYDSRPQLINSIADLDKTKCKKAFSIDNYMFDDKFFTMLQDLKMPYEFYND